MAAEELPTELEEQCSECHQSLVGIERLLKPLLSISRAQMEDKLGLLDAASEVLLLTYAMNSLFWVNLAVKGVNPKSHLVKQELERVQKVMNRARKVATELKASTVQVDSGVAKRFIRSSLWEANKETQSKGGDPGSREGGVPIKRGDSGSRKGEGNKQGSARKKRKVDT